MTEQELSALTLDDIELILKDQRELYSSEEIIELMQRKLELIEEAKLQQHMKREARRLAVVNCPKCDGPNDPQRTTCQFCGYTFKEDDYFAKPQASPKEEEDSETESGGTPVLRLILGFLLTGGGIGSIIYGSNLNNSVMRQLEYVWNSGRTNPGTVWLIVGAVAITLGIVSFASALFSKD